MALTKLEDTTADQIRLLKLVKAAGAKSETGYVWLYVVENHLEEEGYKLGDYYREGGRDNLLRRINLALGRAKKDLALALMKKHGLDIEQANAKVSAAIQGIKAIREVPDLGGDVDDLLSDL